MIKIPVANPYIGEEEAKAVYDVVRSGWISMGEKVEEFEDNFKKFVGAKHAIATNNGTNALHLALIVSGIKEGDEVLIPDITFISTANVVMYERAIPILVECDPKTYNISIKDAEKRLSKKTKAIIPVDMNGLPIDYDQVMDFSENHSLKIISDSAESLGAIYKGRMIGSIAPLNIFSFFPNKNVTTGEGGMITTNDDKKAYLLRQLRNQGQDYRYHHICLGYNYRMTNVSAVIGIEQLKRIEFLITEKEKIAGRYNEAFKDDPNIYAPYIPEYTDRHSWYMYAVSLRKGIDRDKVVSELKTIGIDTRLSFPPIHTQPFYQKVFGYQNDTFPVSYMAWKQLIDLPIWAGLSVSKQNYIIKNIKKIVRNIS